MTKTFLNAFTSKCFWFCFILSVCALFSAIAEQPFSFDFQNYHYYIGYAFLHHRLGVDIAPAMVQTYFTPTLDAFNYLLTLIFPPVLVNMIIGALGGIAIYFAFSLALLLQNNKSAPQRFFFACLSLGFTLCGATTFYQIGTWRGESIAAIFILGAILLLFKCITIQRHLTKGLFFSAFLMGVACGLKLTFIFCLPGFFIAQAVLALNHQTPLRNMLYWTLLTGTGIVIGYSLLNGYWMWTLYQHFQNPFFPMFNTIFHSPYALLHNYHGMVNYIPSHGVAKTLFFPFYWLVKRDKFLIDGPFRDFHIAIVWSITLLAIVIWCYRAMRQKALRFHANLPLALGLFFFISFYTWAVMFSLIRYLYPIQLLSGVMLITVLPTFTLKPKKEALLIIAFILLCVFTTRYPLHRPIERNTATIFRSEYIPGTVATPPKNSIIMLTTVPIAYLIPFYDPSIRFIAVNNWMMRPKHDTLLQHEAERIVSNHTDKLYTVYMRGDAKKVSSVLALYDLAIQKNTCQAFEKGWREFKLCRVTDDKQT